MSSNQGHSSDASEMSTESEAKKKKEYEETVSRSYVILAESNGWRNPDNSIFPISTENLCNYIRAKMVTNSSKSIEWYINGLRRYHEKLYKNKDWELVCKHPDVINLLKKIKAESKLKSEKESFGTSHHHTGKGNWRAEQLNAENRLTGVSTNIRFPMVIEATTKPINSISVEQNHEFLGNIHIPFVAASRNNETMSNLLDGNETDSQEESSGSKSVLAEKFDPMIVGSDSEDDDDEDYEPESFKYRYESAYRSLKAKYAMKCDYHFDGCVPLGEGRHFILAEKLYRRWAALIASGEDFDINSLPTSPELTEFHVDRAVSI
ncbi:12963_t:CDS:2 [Acaulospora colombiana]|uniref:12963_t:CDS:1 n=1 Tax=Acaulospora colombiana TaxID=27376 RepID=A0ACA9M8E4_9GLOM|nr:12963_t:CDS:2 [Acaulospora colombiana]